MKIERRIVLSTEVIDRQGDVLRMSGGKIESYQKNPIFLYMHSPYDILGRLYNVRIEGRELVADGIIFSEKLNEECEIAKQQFLDETLQAFSVGVKILELKQADGYTEITEWELLEVSLVYAGANPDALVAQKMYARKALDFSNSNSNPNKKGMEIKIIAKSLGLGEDAKDDDVLAKAKELGSLEAKYNALVKSVEALAGEDEFGKKLLQKDPVLAMEYFAKKQAEKPVEDNPQGVVTGGLNHIVALLKNGNLGGGTEEKNFEWYQKNDPNGLVALQKENPEKYEKLAQEHLKRKRNANSTN